MLLFSFFLLKIKSRCYYTIEVFILIGTSRVNYVQFPVFCGDIFFCHLFLVENYIVISCVRCMQGWMTSQSPMSCCFLQNYFFYICSKWDEMKFWFYWSQHNVNSIFLLLSKSLLRREAKCNVYWRREQTIKQIITENVLV